jgi:hypothetical protein
MAVLRLQSHANHVSLEQKRRLQQHQVKVKQRLDQEHRAKERVSAKKRASRAQAQ